MSDATQPTRAFLQALFAQITTTGWSPAFLDSLSDDVVWTATGSSPLSGRVQGKDQYRDQILLPLFSRLEGPVNPIVDMILADGSWGAVYWHSEGVRGKNGLDFSMEYCWLMKVVSSKIVEVIGFYDQVKVRDIFASPPPTQASEIARTIHRNPRQ